MYPVRGLDNKYSIWVYTVFKSGLCSDRYVRLVYKMLWAASASVICGLSFFFLPWLSFLTTPTHPSRCGFYVALDVGSPWPLAAASTRVFRRPPHVFFCWHVYNETRIFVLLYFVVFRCPIGVRFSLPDDLTTTALLYTAVGLVCCPLCRDFSASRGSIAALTQLFLDA